MHSRTSALSCIRLGALLLGAALALGVLGPASAGTLLASKYGGTLVVGLHIDPGTLDPTVSRSATANEVYLTMCQTLYDPFSKLGTVPVLAAAPPVLSKDKLSYTIQLRQGVRFNDDTPFNAQAVVTSYERYVTFPASAKADDFASVESVTATGPYTVVYHLEARDSTFTGNMYVLSPTQLTKLGDNFATNPVCVGPFMFDHRVAGDSVTVIKSPWYYDRKNVYLDKIVFKSITDTAAAAAALKAGDIDVLNSVDTTELDAVREKSSLRVIQAPSLGWQGIVINLGNRSGVLSLPYSNKGTPLASSAKLRQAFEEAIDRNALNRVVFGGGAQVSCTPIPPANTAWYDATKVPCAPYDPKHAKKLVAASGIANPTVHLSTPNLTRRLRVAEFIQAQEKAVGINVVIDSLDTLTETARRLSGDFEASMFGFGGGDGDPSAVISRFLATSGGSNYSGYSSPRLDFILGNGRKATSILARSTLYRAAQQIIASDRPILFLYNPVTFTGFNANVTGVQMTAHGLMSVAFAQFR